LALAKGRHHQLSKGRRDTQIPVKHHRQIKQIDKDTGRMEKYTYKNNLIGRGIYGEAARLFWRAYPNALTKEKARFYAYHYRTVNK